MKTHNIRFLGPWIVDFTLQTAYLIDSAAGTYTEWSSRVKDETYTKPRDIGVLPENIKDFLKDKTIHAID